MSARRDWQRSSNKHATKAAAGKNTVTAKWPGRCFLCEKPYQKDDTIKADEYGTGWGHSRCVNKEAREAAAARKLDENAAQAAQRRWNTAI